eukprot:GHVN01087204.1.p1 GENE.GHVN01087204.1~~GHVN01087204.1.p1  ORF type:complete len:111 (+),score=23.63 GHVN01087204.1:407-739(+)
MRLLDSIGGPDHSSPSLPADTSTPPGTHISPFINQPVTHASSFNLTQPNYQSISSSLNLAHVPSTSRNPNSSRSTSPGPSYGGVGASPAYGLRASNTWDDTRRELLKLLD